MKTKEELNVLKAEVEALNKKLHELTEEELKQVSGGAPALGKAVEINDKIKGEIRPLGSIDNGSFSSQDL